MATSRSSDFHVAIVGEKLGLLVNSCSLLTQHKGAGIGGLALAMALHKKNVSFMLYEEAAEYSVVG